MASHTLQPARFLSGQITVPGDKSISHRAVLIGAISHGKTWIRNCLDAADVRTTLQAVKALGVPVQEVPDVSGQKRPGGIAVEGCPDRRLTLPTGPLDMGNSGTTARLLLGILAGHPFEATLVGDASLSKRPMRRVIEPLQKMGATFLGPGEKDHLPLTIQGGNLRGIDYPLTVPSAQVKSAILLAGLYAEGPTTVLESIPTRDHTEQLLRAFGANLKREGSSITLAPGEPLQGREFLVPGDFSSAAFFLVAAAILPNSSVTVKGVGLNPTRIGLLELLKRMGAQVRVSLSRESEGPDAWEPWGDVEVKAGLLSAVTIQKGEVPRLIDELPALMVAATQAKGETIIEEASELRIKETDRIRSMVEGLTAMGAKIRAEADSVVIEGPTRLKAAKVSSFGDHRTAMALSIAALVAEQATTIEGSEWVEISYPGFFETLNSIRR